MTYSDKARAYAAQVAAGSILACKWIRLAGERHVRDLAQSAHSDWPYRYDEDKANRVCAFIERLPHVKGKWAKLDPITRQPGRLKLEPWQCFIICSLFGWVKKSTGKRRFRKASIYVPRKNAKSTLAAGIAWWMFGKDDENGAEVYSGATSEKQAWEVFGPLRQMAISIPALATGLGVTVNAASLVNLKTNSKCEPIIGKPGDGASPHCSITDEFHEHPTSEQYDTMITGMGAREQPLALITSTAGSNLAGPCREDWKTCEKILERVQGFEDDTHFALIYTIDDGDDWTTEEALRKANPNFEVSVSREFLLDQLAVAKRDPRAQSTYRTKHLDQWVTSKSGYFNLQTWHGLEDKSLRIEDFAGKPCFLSADFASKHDLVSLMALFPLDDGKFAVFGRHYLPRATVELPENQHYRTWETAGHVVVTEGNITDLEALIADAVEMNGKYQVIEMPFDPNRAWGVSTRLSNEGINVIEYRNVVLTMSEPMKFLDALIRSGKIVHDGCPVLAWALSNVTAQLDKKDNVYPNKERPENKIDPVVSLLMALGRAMTQPTPTTPGIEFI